MNEIRNSKFEIRNSPHSRFYQALLLLFSMPWVPVLTSAEELDLEPLNIAKGMSYDFSAPPLRFFRMTAAVTIMMRTRTATTTPTMTPAGKEECIYQKHDHPLSTM